MNDELDALRSFRPEAAGPSETLQLRERLALTATIARSRTGASHRKPLLRSPRRVALAVSLAVVTVVGTAAAAGVIPDDVRRALGFASAGTPDTSLTPQIDQAVERTSTPTADGGTLQLWTAPTTGGGTCAYLRRLDAAGAPTDPGPVSCAVSIAGSGRMGEMTMNGQPGSHAPGTTMTMGDLFAGGRLSAQVQIDAGGAATVFGLGGNEVADVEVVDSAGAVLAETAADNGWFLLTLPADAFSSAASLVVQSASGATLAVMRIVPPPPATASTTDADTDRSSEGP
jgi:hypothetical protein